MRASLVLASMWSSEGCVVVLVEGTDAFSGKHLI